MPSQRHHIRFFERMLLLLVVALSAANGFLSPLATTRNALPLVGGVSRRIIAMTSLAGFRLQHTSRHPSSLQLFSTNQQSHQNTSKSPPSREQKKRKARTLPASFVLRIMAIALCVTTLRSVPEQALPTVAVRLSTAAITMLDFAPTASKQWKDTSSAMQSQPSVARKFYNLVRIKTLGELLGLGIMVASADLALLGASVVLSSHLGFWLAGGGKARVDSSGTSMPMPPGLVSSIFLADLSLLAAVLVGRFASTLKLRSIGEYVYSTYVTMLCAEKIKKQFKPKTQVKKEQKDSVISTNTSGVAELVIPQEKEVLEPAEPWEFDWRRHWYPLAFSQVTDKSVPHRLELFGEHLVLWHNGTQWAALADACPHRLAPLSEGRIDEEGQIECPYHGWTFTNQGACTAIPQATNSTKVLGACSARAYQIVEKQGMIWAWGTVGARPEDADESLIPICPALEDDRFVWIDFSRDLPYGADTLLENVLDASHVPFTHHKTISRRDTAKPLPLSLTTPISAKGFEGEMESDVPIGKTGEENAKQGLVTRRTTGFEAPTYMHNKIKSASTKDMDFDKGSETWTVVYATPTGPGRSRLLARFPFRFPPPRRRFLFIFRLNLPSLIFKFLPDWINHMGQMKVTDDDNIFLPIQERYTREVGGWKKYRMPTDADTYVRGFRRWYSKAGPPPHSTFTQDIYKKREPAMEELLDRRSQHTKHCSSCQGALKNAKRVRDAARAVLVAAVAVIPTLAVQKMYKPLGGVAITGAIVALMREMASRVEESLTTGLGDYPPPRNQPDMKRRNRELRTVEEGRKF